MKNLKPFSLGLALASALFLAPGIIATAQAGIDHCIDARILLAMRWQVDRIYDDLETLHPSRVHHLRRGARYVR